MTQKRPIKWYIFKKQIWCSSLSFFVICTLSIWVYDPPPHHDSCSHHKQRWWSWRGSCCGWQTTIRRHLLLRSLHSRSHRHHSWESPKQAPGNPGHEHDHIVVIVVITSIVVIIPIMTRESARVGSRGHEHDLIIELAKSTCWWSATIARLLQLPRQSTMNITIWSTIAKTVNYWWSSTITDPIADL